MNILVTGGAGYIGSVLCEELLNRGHDVTVIDKLIYNNHNLAHLCRNPHFKFIYKDVLDIESKEWYNTSYDVIIPLAAIVGAPACDKQKMISQEVNEYTIKDMIQHRISDGQKFIYLNTNSGYGTKSGEAYCDEETPLEPISYYGQYKVAAEKYVRQFSNVVVLRLATVFGVSPRMRTDLLVNEFIHKIIKEKSLVVYEPDVKRNFVYIGDVAKCIADMAENDAVGVYNFGNDDLNMSKRELVECLSKHFDFEVFYGEKGFDPDKRNYIVSNQKIKWGVGIRADTSIDDVIYEFKNYYTMMNKFQYGNV